MRIHKNYPGGNISVGEVKGRVVKLEQEIRDTTIWWFYWGFCVESPDKGEFIFEFTNKDVVGPWGPTISFDRVKWDWLGSEAAISRNSFKYTFNGTETRVYFSLSLPYQLDDFDRFYARLQKYPHVQRSVLATSEGGRNVPLLKIGRASAANHVMFTARHHACESVASYVLEGLVEYIAKPEGAGLLDEYTFHIVPFVDIDGVEEGDQGKCRHPYDHCRDYHNKPIYKATAALMKYFNVNNISHFVDFHCPWIWAYGKMRDNHPFFCKGLSPMKEKVENLGWLLQKATQSNKNIDKIIYDPVYDIEMGEDWMVPKDLANSSWVYLGNTGIALSTAFEVPYFGTNDCIYTQKNTRALGADFGRAFKEYLPQAEHYKKGECMYEAT